MFHIYLTFAQLAIVQFVIGILDSRSKEYDEQNMKYKMC